ncbi:MAG: DUF5777 family beta-barrel protein [bacterium]
MKKYFLLVALATLCSFVSLTNAFAQEPVGLLDLVGDSTTEVEYVKNAFKSTRIINSQSIEMLGAGSLDFRVLHRFGPVNSGAGNLFGLDEASTRFSFDFAPTNDLLVGIGRSSRGQKEFDGFIKYDLLQQSQGLRTVPLTVVLVAGMTLSSTTYSDPTVTNFFTSRMSFFQQILLGRKFSDDISLQLSPTLIHQNLVTYASDPHNIIALGVGGRVKITNRVSFTIDWTHPFNSVQSSIKHNDPLAIGFDIETGGHVFQVHFSNSVGLNERTEITETTDNWLKGGIRLGFNLSRVFQL